MQHDATRNATRISSINIALNGKTILIDGSDQDKFFKRYDTLTAFYCWNRVDYIPGIFSSGIIIPTKDPLFSKAIYISDDKVNFGRINHNDNTVVWHSISKTS